MVYWPVLTANMFGRPDVAFVIRSERAGTASLMNEVRQAVRSVNGTIPMTREGTMRDLYADSLARTSFTLVMLAIAGAMALALGVVGIYGVIAYVVSQRTREIGIRSALGAEPRQLKKMFLLHGLTLSAVGVVVGVVVAAALGRSMSSLLFGIEAHGPRSLYGRDRRHSRGRGARELPAGAARGEDRSDGNDEGGVTRSRLSDAYMSGAGRSGSREFESS